MDSKRHFLVVNDSPHIRRVIVSLLKELGYVKVSVDAITGVLAKEPASCHICGNAVAPEAMASGAVVGWSKVNQLGAQ